MYIPQHSKPINELYQGWQQIRLMIQGPPRGGKTTSAMTFPNPVVLNFDNNLPAFHNRKDIHVVPFHDAKFIVDVMKKPKTHAHAKQPNRRDALIDWLTTEGYKLQQDQTLVIDSWTTVQDAFDVQQILEPARTKTGAIDDFDFWAKKIEYCENLCNILKGLTCHVVITLHEQQERDKETGQLLTKLQPMMQGKFVAKMPLYFTDVYAALVRGKREKYPDGKYLRDEKGEIIPEYYWQVKSDDLRNLGGRAKFDTAILINPHYNLIAPHYGLPTI